MAASLALGTSIMYRSSLTVNDSPRLRPRAEPAAPTAAEGTFTTLFKSSDSRMRMAVIILVVEAISNCLSGFRE